VKLLTAITNGLARIEAVALAICLLTMLSVAFFQVVMRNIYGIGYVWADILVRILVLWVGLLGATLATHECRHLTIDAITKFLPVAVTRVVRVIVRIFALVVCVLLTGASWDYIQLQKTTSMGKGLFGMPPWVTEVIIPIAFLLISIHFFVLIIQGIVDVFLRTDISAPPEDAI
jgi:TRAP-type C4-dicarboxylate transport system permease small subunit